MESISFLLDRLGLAASTTTNFILERISKFKPSSPRLNPIAIANHQNTLLHAFNEHLYTNQVHEIVHGYRRAPTSELLVYEDFFAGDIPTHTIPKDEHYYQALEYTRKRFAPPHLCRPAHLLDVEHHYPHRSKSNAEAPFSTESFYLDILRSPDYRAKHQLPENAKASTGNMKSIIFDFVRRWHHEIKDATVPINARLFYMLLHTKTALVRTDSPDKTRTIWGTPKCFVLAEIMFHWSLLAHYKRNPGLTPLLWGYEIILGGMFRINAELFQSHTRFSVITIDKSRFDKHALFEAYDDLDTMTRSFLDFDSGYLPTHDYPDTRSTWTLLKAQRLERLWQWTCYAFRNTPIVLPDGRAYKRTHAGLPSGLYTTQYRGSTYNHLTIATCLLAMGIELTRIISIKIQGDDSLTHLAVLVPPNEHQAFLDTFASLDDYYFGSVIHPDKSSVNNGPQGSEYFGYHNNHGIPIRDPIKLLAQFYHTKASSPTPSLTMAAAVGFAYADCAQHKQVYNVCKNVFDYYSSQGYTPDMASISDMVFNEQFSSYSLPDPSVFPSRAYISQHLLDGEYSTPSTMQQFYPESHFLTRF